MSMGVDYDYDFDVGGEGEVEVVCEYIAETAKAIKVNAGGVIEWFPKSACEFTKNSGMMGVLLVPKWLMIKKGLRTG